MKITQPSGFLIDTPGMQMRLDFNSNFAQDYSARFARAQKAVDLNCLELMEPYTPMQTGFLYKSSYRGTVQGTGEIEYLAPYARYLYYGVVYGPNFKVYDKDTGEFAGWRSPPKKFPTQRQINYSTKDHLQAGKLWFERMKADRGDEILAAAQKILGGS